MAYKYMNGREAKLNDPVVGQDISGDIVVGRIHRLTSEHEPGNCKVAITTHVGPKAVYCFTKNLYHARDAQTYSDFARTGELRIHRDASNFERSYIRNTESTKDITVLRIVEESDTSRPANLDVKEGTVKIKDEPEW